VPNEGVGMVKFSILFLCSIKFQSFCAEWGRWNHEPTITSSSSCIVSILLCRMRALELYYKENPEKVKELFQSFCAEWGRWNTASIIIAGVTRTRFNPFVPNEGVGIRIETLTAFQGRMFQSFCAEWGRWNMSVNVGVASVITVSILLCRMRALE